MLAKKGLKLWVGQKICGMFIRFCIKKPLVLQKKKLNLFTKFAKHWIRFDKYKYNTYYKIKFVKSIILYFSHRHIILSGIFINIRVYKKNIYMNTIFN